MTFACGLKLSGTASRTERGDARSVPVEFLLPGKQHEPRDRPQEMKDVQKLPVPELGTFPFSPV